MISLQSLLLAALCVLIAANDYKLDKTWQLPAEVTFGACLGLALDDQAGEVYIGQTGSAALPVVVLDKNGTYLRSWGNGTITKGQPHGIRVRYYQGETTVWVADQGDHTVKYFTPDGELLGTLGTPNQAGTSLSPLQFDQVTNIDFDSTSGNFESIFIADGERGLNNRIIALNPDFTVRWNVSGYGSGHSQFSDPHAITFDPLFNRVWVADRGNNRSQVFSHYGNGAYVGEFTRQSGCFPMSPWSNAIGGEGGKTLFTITGNSDSESAPYYGTLSVLQLEQSGHSVGPCETLQTLSAGVLDQHPHAIVYDTTNQDLYISYTNGAITPGGCLQRFRNF